MVIRRLLAYLKPHRNSLILALLLLLTATAAEVTGPILVQTFIDDYLTVGLFPWVPLVLLAGGYLLLRIIASTMMYFQQLRFFHIAFQVIQQLRIDVFNHVQHLGLSYFDRIPGGALVSRITNDTEAIKELFVSVLSTFVQNIVLISGIFVAMFLLDYRLALVCLLLLPMIYALMATYRRLSFHVYRVVRQKLSDLNAMLSESIQGMNMIQALRQEERLKESFAHINHQHYVANLKNTRLNGLLLRPAVDSLYFLAVIVALTYFGVILEASSVQIGVMYAFVSLLDRMFEPVNRMMMQLPFLQQSIVSAGRVFDLLDEKERAPQKVGTTDPHIMKGKIEFDRVSFSYDGKNPVLKNISFTVEPGQTVAIVGHTGSGKTSIINLLMRFYSLNEGKITIDGAELETFREEELRMKMGLVLQDPFLFVGTVEENIALARPGTTAADVREAVQFVQADSIISKLAHGYQEKVKERGASFSSGERQLLSFARTMAQKPRILILDEATASVDTETEEKIQEALHRMRKGRTTIAIAHRLSTIKDADIILVLHKGEIVERGAHQELLAQKGLYFNMYQLQQGLSERVVG
ncbi:ABC transporter ATP-binding protein [Mechercharimyces sp. CAU 1602]|uniref:ABC transporter ATP-binding protein n=1 Tax=Mechercharimyces sp. CAU 1602 TaxID=2973933 RepID=UPI002163DB4B|nr:ABC transporter transmembrane domain-containing protein [Mechercharimyces sp. CAU 1602]MCS1351654.1 ABC transporter transmembrane domain-containing protein [Mechercharimyces sp. CAU 1602]